MRFTFAAGPQGAWHIESITPVLGGTLPAADRLNIVPAGQAQDATWSLDGVVSNIRYATANEAGQLRSVQEDLGRPHATRAALIPIGKSSAWWGMAQDERRAIFEEQSHHTEIGLEYLPQIARKLYHCRDIAEPFDFLTWFEYAPEHSDAFEHLVERLRATREWTYVDREVDIRLSR